MMIDGTVLSTAILSIGTGLGGFLGGRMTGRSMASQVASDTVEMLSTQNDLLKQEKEDLGLVLLDLQTRVGVLEGLVTQRAEVGAVQVTVDRIAAKVGA